MVPARPAVPSQWGPAWASVSRVSEPSAPGRARVDPVCLPGPASRGSGCPSFWWVGLGGSVEILSPHLWFPAASGTEARPGPPRAESKLPRPPWDSAGVTLPACRCHLIQPVPLSLCAFLACPLPFPLCVPAPCAFGNFDSGSAWCGAPGAGRWEQEELSVFICLACLHPLLPVPHK